MKQKILIIGNWKMNPATEKEALAIAKIYKTLTFPKYVDFGIASPVPYFAQIKKTISKNSVFYGVQNIYGEKSGAHTGEISLGMLEHLKPAFSLVGHSERRAQGETDAMINQKIILLLKNKVTPVLCVGETTRDDHGHFLRVIADQLKHALTNVPKAAFPRLVIAYEPVWAIGKDAVRETTPDECREAIVYIKKTLADMAQLSAKDMPRIIYGGSVNEANAQSYIHAGADGLLPGHISLEPKKMQKLFDSLQTLTH